MLKFCVVPRGHAIQCIAGVFGLAFIIFGIGSTKLAAQTVPVLQIPTKQRPLQVLPAQLPRLKTNKVAEKPLPHQIMAMPDVHETLEVIHHRSQLVVARTNITRTAIADPTVIELVQYSPNEIAIIGMGLGSTTLTLWFNDSPNPLIYLVKTIRDPSLDEQKQIDYGRLERKLAVLFPNSKVYLIPLSGKIVVKGQARDPQEASRILQIIRGEVINQEGSLVGPQAQAGGGGGGGGGLGIGAGAALGGNGLGLYSGYIVNMLEVPGEFQVNIRVVIAELNRAQLRRFGINFNDLFNNGRHSIGYALGGIPSTLTGIFENGEISVLVDLLASNGTIKLLSNPVLTVLSGHSASFIAGGEFAVPTIIGIGGAQGQQTSFRGFGTSMIVTPTVVDRDLIRMQIVPEFSAINQSNAVGGIPGLDTRRVQTTVELREGQTIAIAGLISHQTTTETTRIPFLGDIPYLGARIFSAKKATQDESELLILVTPELVRPMDPEEVPPVPGFDVTHPNHWEFYKGAMTEGVPDTGYYQLPPYGRGAGQGIDVGYHLFNPAPASPLYSPEATDPYGSGHSIQLTPSQPQVIPQRRPPGGPPSGHHRPQPGQTPPPALQPRPNIPPPAPSPMTTRTQTYHPQSRLPVLGAPQTYPTPPPTSSRPKRGISRLSKIVPTMFTRPRAPTQYKVPKLTLPRFGRGRNSTRR